MLPHPHSVFSQADSPVVTVVLAEAFCWEEAHPAWQEEQEGARNPCQVGAVCCLYAELGWLPGQVLTEEPEGLGYV